MTGDLISAQDAFGHVVYIFMVLVNPRSNYLLLRYLKEREICLDHFSSWTEQDQIEFVEELLKCMQQEILAPAVISMHEDLSLNAGGEAAFAFKDLRGAWRLGVRFLPESVTVTHFKGETSISPLPTDYFKFEWALELTLDREVCNPNTCLALLHYPQAL